MPNLESPANLLAQSYYRTLPFWAQSLIIILGGITLSRWIVWGKLNPHLRNRHYWLLHILFLGSFGLLCEGLFWARSAVSVPLSLLAWGVTALSAIVWMELGLRQDTIDQQQCEIDRLHTVEQSAVISQAHKLLHRIASNIHDGPLQELKVVMDRLELLQMNSTPVDLDPILDRLADLGHHLRQQLNQTREIAL